MTGHCAIVNGSCPRTADPERGRFCPAWWESLWLDDKGETHVRKGCAWSQLPDYFTQMVKHSVQAAASSQEARDSALVHRQETERQSRALLLTLYHRGAVDESPSLPAIVSRSGDQPSLPHFDQEHVSDTGNGAE